MTLGSNEGSDAQRRPYRPGDHVARLEVVDRGVAVFSDRVYAALRTSDPQVWRVQTETVIELPQAEGAPPINYRWETLVDADGVGSNLVPMTTELAHELFTRGDGYVQESDLHKDLEPPQAGIDQDIERGGRDGFDR